MRRTYKDQRAWDSAHAGDWVSVAAWGLKSHVGVAAQLGGRCGERRYFVVPADEYAARSTYGFVVDPARHTETTADWRVQS